MAPSERSDGFELIESKMTLAPAQPKTEVSDTYIVLDIGASTVDKLHVGETLLGLDTGGGTVNNSPSVPATDNHHHLNSIIVNGITQVAPENERLSSGPKNSPGYNDIFCDDVPVEVVVGSEKVTFYAHKSFLFNAAALKSKYESNEKASEVGAIFLPDEDPVQFGKILRFLYFGTEQMDEELCGGGSEEENCTYHYKRIAELYIRASNYQLLELKRYFLILLSSWTDIEPCLEFFHHLYLECTGDVQLRTFFKERLASILRVSVHDDSQCLFGVEPTAGYAAKGGDFAADLASGLADAHLSAIKTERESARKLRAKSDHDSGNCLSNECDYYNKEINGPRKQGCSWREPQRSDRWANGDTNNSGGWIVAGEAKESCETAQGEGRDSNVQKPGIWNSAMFALPRLQMQ